MTIVSFGGASTSPDFLVRGYVRSAQKNIIQALKKMSDGRCTLYMVDEYRSTNCCSKCHNISPPTTKKKHQYCEPCKTTWNRDVDAGRRMITRGLHKHFGWKLPFNLMRPSCGPLWTTCGEQITEKTLLYNDIVMDSNSDSEDESDSD